MTLNNKTNKFKIINKYKHTDSIIFLFCIIGLIIEFGRFSLAHMVEITLGAIGIIYCTYYIILCFQPIKRDYILSNGNFLLKTINFVLFIPFLITFVLITYNILKDINLPQSLLYEENLYPNLYPKGELPDTITKKQEAPSTFWSVYYHFIDPGNQHMTTTTNGRQLAALIAILGTILLNGLLISTLISWFDRRKEQWLKGEVKYPYFFRRKKHYVIIGGNDMAFGIVRQILAKEEEYSNMPYILIQTTRDVEEFRRELFSTLSEQQQQHMIIFYGSRTSEKELKSLYLHQATEIYILGEQTRTDWLEPYHDTANMQCFDLISQLLQDINATKNLIRCYVMFEYQTSFAAFQSSNQQRIIKTDDGKELLSFIPFSPYESWAQKVLVNGELTIPNNRTIKYNNIDGDGISYDSDKSVHLIIVGMSKMGVAMAIETAHLAHFPNFVRDNSKRTKITFIDKNAREESEFFMGRFPDLFKLCKWTDVDGKKHNPDAPTCHEYQYFAKNFLDIEWEFRNGGVEAKENREYIEHCFHKNSREIITIAICLPWPHQSLAAALYLPKVAIHKANDIWVYQPQSGELLTDINKGTDKSEHIWDMTTYRKLKPFGMLSMGFDANLLENEAIWYCSNFYKAKDALVNKFKVETDDESTCYWNNWNRNNVEEAVLSEIDLSLGELWAIWSNIYQINTIEFKRRSLGLDFSKLDEPDVKELFAKVEHNRWNIEKLLMGYKPLEDHELDEDEIETIKEYLREKQKVNKDELEKIQYGINERDIYYNWEKECFKVKKVKKFYKDGPIKAHPNICPFECLPMDDKNYDICFTLAMPFLDEKRKIRK